LQTSVNFMTQTLYNTDTAERTHTDTAERTRAIEEQTLPDLIQSFSPAGARSDLVFLPGWLSTRRRHLLPKLRRARVYSRP
jgi:hypothetical protein